jgi:hypothetical protein
MAQIFLSYAREDEETVKNLYQKLSDAGFKPWMDKKDILPGERWKSSVRGAIRRSDFFLACLSANSVSKRGFLQKEIKDALDIWQEMLDSDIYLIPVRLEDCEVPETLRGFHWVNLFEENGWTRLVESIQVGMERRAEVSKHVVPESPETKAVAVQVTVLLESDIQKFTLVERESFVFALSRIVNISPDQIRILRVASGSMLITLEMPEEAAQLLVSMYLARDPVLQTLRIVKVELRPITASPDISRQKAEAGVRQLAERLQLTLPTEFITGFVDRECELALFRCMLAGETDERIQLILERGEQGKTYLLLRLFHECEQQRPQVPVVLLDFDQRRSDLTDYLSVAREVRRHLGDKCTPAICACEDEIYRRGPLVSIRTGPGDAGVDWGRRGRFTKADIADIAGRDLIQVGPVSEAAPAADLIARQRADMGRALRCDLASLAASHRRVVLLVDTFEHAPEDTRSWLERWVFEPLRHELRHVLFVVAGRPECQSFFAQPRLWSSLVATIDPFIPFSDDDILAHYRQRGLPVAEAEMPLLLDLARLSPARMSQVGDWLQQTRRGAR